MPETPAVKPHPYALLLIALLVCAAMASRFTGVPSPLPAIALNSTLLFHIERTIAIFGGALILVVVLVEAWKGSLPAEISGRGLKYERFKEETRAGLDALSEAVAEERKAREQNDTTASRPLDSTPAAE